MLRAIVAMVSLIGLPLLIFGVSASKEAPSARVLALYITGYACFPVVWIGQRWFAPRTRVALTLLAIFLLATVVLLRLGLSGPGTIFLLSLSVIAAMLLGLRIGLWSAAAGVTLLVAGAIATGLGWHHYPPWVEQLSNAPIAWLFSAASFLLVSGAAVYGPGVLFSVLGRQRRDLIAANQRLQQEIVERIEAEAEGQKLRDQLLHAQKMEAIGRLTGGVAHEFNNLLVVIATNAELLAAQVAQRSSLHEIAQEIGVACDRARGLTRQLLTFSRRELGKVTNVDLDELVRSNRRLLEPLLGEHIAMHLELKGAGCAKLDPRQVGQVLINLVLNARDALADGGAIQVRTYRRAISPEEALGKSLPDAGEFAVLEVRDDGPGMSDEVSQQIFEPFFTTKAEGHGTGLGLSTAFGIVRRLGGFFELETSPGSGATFRAHFPASDEPVEHLPSAPDLSAAVPASGNAVLLVEDEPLVQKASRRLLVHLGYEVAVADDGSEAWELYQANPDRFDLVMTDVSMPTMGGFELAKRIFALRPQAKVLFVSGYSGDTEFIDYVQQGNAPFVLKPFEAATLGATLKQLLSEKVSQGLGDDVC